MSDHDETPPKGDSDLYQEAYADHAYKLSRLGCGDEDLALFFEVAPGTVNRWKREHPEFRIAIKAGALSVMESVERATIRNICGFYATKRRVVRGKEIEYRRWVPGNPWAGMRWLEMRGLFPSSG